MECSLGLPRWHRCNGSGWTRSTIDVSFWSQAALASLRRSIVASNPMSLDAALRIQPPPHTHRRARFVEPLHWAGHAEVVLTEHLLHLPNFIDRTEMVLPPHIPAILVTTMYEYFAAILVATIYHYIAAILVTTISTVLIALGILVIGRPSCRLQVSACYLLQ